MSCGEVAFFFFFLGVGRSDRLSLPCRLVKTIFVHKVDPIPACSGVFPPRRTEESCPFPNPRFLTVPLVGVPGVRMSCKNVFYNAVCSWFDVVMRSPFVLDRVGPSPPHARTHAFPLIETPCSLPCRFAGLYFPTAIPPHPHPHPRPPRAGWTTCAPSLSPPTPATWTSCTRSTLATRTSLARSPRTW